MKKIFKILFFILAVIVLSGCTICRHKVLSDYAWAVEQGYRPEIVLYTTTPATQAASLWIWNGHTQSRVGDKWVLGSALWEDPEYPLGTYCWSMTIEQYIEWLYGYKESSQKPYIEQPDWPRCE